MKDEREKYIEVDKQISKEIIDNDEIVLVTCDSCKGKGGYYLRGEFISCDNCDGMGCYELGF